MRNYFDKQLSLLHKKLIDMGIMCESAINMVSDALESNNHSGNSRIEQLEVEIDRMEREIESFCLKLLLQQQPVARDLRQISAALKLITDMERIGDQAADISEIISHPTFTYKNEHVGLRAMADATGKMVTKSIDAYVKQDLSMAEEVIAYDDIVDELFHNIRKDLILLLSEDISKGEHIMDLLMIAKYFERIGDHAENIAEWVKFSVTGIHEGGID